ncbi:MAG: AMP-binding protein [Bacteroidales bacterium]|nr:AMP-binding protein [Bacteroidales bacterium]MDD2424845.1 AMP-binding protein [Bacteroidales bacterium]MDD3989971.1 AMP-binding protein [Bacteroidales bacterium]MDD4639016.1 AMP-binding protein [Bacteroidales bacterium]
MIIEKFETLKDLYSYSTERYSARKAFGYSRGFIYTYSDFKEKTDYTDKLLTASGIGPGDKVAILSQNMPNWPVAYFAATAFKRVVVPILPDFSENEVRNVIEHSEASAIFVSERLFYKVSEDIRNRMPLFILDTLTKGNEIINNTSGITDYGKPEDLASIIYTSGTTGNSKGVMLSQRNICSHLYAAAMLRPGYDWDVWLSILPLSHTLESSLSMLLPMVSGSSVYFLEKAPTPTLLIQALRDVRPTTMLSVPMIIEKIFRSSVLPSLQSGKVIRAIYGTTPGRKLLHRVAGKKLMKVFGGRIRFFGIGGAKLDSEVERFLYEAKFPYAIGYGLTESSPLLAGAIPSMVKWQSTGPAVYGVSLRIDNPDPHTGEGEIVAKGPNIMMGYYKNEEATAEAFTEDGWFRTKDLGIIDKKGWLYIKGRLSNMILGPSGENIYPEEIESVINAHAMVAESIVTQEKGKLVALVHFNPEKIKNLMEAKDEALEAYYQKKEQIIKSYGEKKEQFVKFYEEKKEEAIRVFNEKIEQLKKEVMEHVNSKVNKFSKITSVVDHPEQFEKTATQKIKRYLYKQK